MSSIKINVPMTIDWDRKPNRKHFLKHLIDSNKFETVLEVGVRDGRTTFHLLNQCRTIKKYWAVDMNIDLFYSKKVAQAYGDKLVAIEGMSQDVHHKIEDGSCDIIFIDADHSYPAVKQDIINYRPKLKPGGILSGHDIDFPGVNQAVNEMLENYDVGPNNVWFVRDVYFV
jgi:predicted O-methyltransferase YrrM